MPTSQLDPWAVGFAAAHSRTGRTHRPWPEQVPPLARPTPDRLRLRGIGRLSQLPGAWFIPLAPLALITMTAVWGSGWRIVAAQAIVVMALAVVVVAAGRSGLEADCQGILVAQPLGEVWLPWSVIAGVRCPEPRRLYRQPFSYDVQLFRVGVELLLSDGTVVAPFVTRRMACLHTVRGVERAVADWVDLDRLWHRFGPAAAPAMWTRPSPVEPAFEPPSAPARPTPVESAFEPPSIPSRPGPVPSPDEAAS